ncbi:TetR/AcrR family transcriptional regulator [Mycobacterium seoulense]|uniref:TetR/AcrR family transcriptional regulator n=1 Tax=Mycobacterium seoulense TaxID=386911 RepID=UPI003CED7ADB
MATERKPRTRRGSAPGLIRDAARQLFAEQGYGTTTREIAERAGVSHELIFRYFESKGNLFVEAVLNPLLDTVDQLHGSWLTDVSESRGTEKEYLREFVTAFFDFLTDNSAIAQAMIRLLADSTNDEEVQNVRRRIDSTLQAMVTPLEAYSTGSNIAVPRPGLQLRVMLLTIGVTANVLSYTYASDDAVPSREEIFEVILSSAFSMWGLGMEETEGSAGPARRKRR